MPQKHINMQISFVLVMIKPVYGHFTLILQKEKWYIKTFCYKIFENHLYTKFGKKKKKKKNENYKYIGNTKKSIVFAYACSFMSFFFFF